MTWLTHSLFWLQIKVINLITLAFLKSKKTPAANTDWGFIEQD